MARSYGESGRGHGPLLRGSQVAGMARSYGESGRGRGPRLGVR
jgi:hypothetical protein